MEPQGREDEAFAPVEPHPQLQDLEHYLRQNGIEARQQQQPYQGMDHMELAANVSAQEQYEKEAIEKFVKEDEDKTAPERELRKQKKQMIIDELMGPEKTKTKTISIQTRDGVLRNVPLYNLVTRCDTIYTLASSDHWSNEMRKDDFVFSLLEQFSSKSVEHFLLLLNATKSQIEGVRESTSCTSDQSDKLADDDSSNASIQDVINNDNIIECCQIAHILQCTELLADIVDIIQASIDSDNCTSLCILADQLNIPSLLQSSMAFVLDRLEHIQSYDDGQLWNDIPSSLKTHILTLRNAASSSIIGRGQTSEVLFSSSDEFLAIFYDTMRDHKERLCEAKQRQQEIIDERLRLNEKKRFCKDRDVYSGDVKDAAIKIEKQEKRVKTLEAFYREQKSIFKKDSNGKFQGSFKL
jgi:hypothetical protein